MSNLHLSKSDVEKRLGITCRQLDFWVWQGYIHPDNANAGTGAARDWPQMELEIARRMGVLTKAGVKARQAAEFARNGWPRGEIAPGIVIEITDGQPS